MDAVWVGAISALLGAVVGGWFGLWGAKVAAASAKALQNSRHAFEQDAESRRIRLDRLEKLYVELYDWKLLLESMLVIDLHWMHGKITTEQRLDQHIERAGTGRADFSRLKMMLDIHMSNQSAVVEAMLIARSSAMGVAEDEMTRLKTALSIQVKGDPHKLAVEAKNFSALVNQLLDAISADARAARTPAPRTAGDSANLAARFAAAWSILRGSNA